MRTLHRWFRSGNYSLLGHVDLPQTCEGLGALIVPPFGWEDVCSYRPLRILARSLAEAGIPTLRFDLPGTGDSSGGLLDSGLLPAWITSISDAAAELRAAAGVEQVALVGVRLGAMLGMVAASRDPNFRDLVLWGPASSGRAEFRELRAFANMERWEYSTQAPAPSPPIPGFEVGGFLISPETQRDLEALDLSALSGLRGRRILLLSRDHLRPDPNLVRAFESAGCTLQLATGSGYSEMMAPPHEALPPVSVAHAILDFLAGGRPAQAKSPALASIESRDAQRREPSLIESVYTIRASSESIFGVLAEPVAGVPPADWCILFLNAGGVRHTGPNRMWVDAARRWAARGVASLRFDLRGIGESDGPQNLDIAALYQEGLVDQVELAMESLHSTRGFQRFAAIGLCSGAFWAFHAAIHNPAVRAAVLLNPRLFFWDPEVDRRRLLRRTAQGLGSSADWRRVVSGGVQTQDLKRAAKTLFVRLRTGRRDADSHLQIPPLRMTAAWKSIERHGTRLSLIFTEGEPLLREMQEEGQMPPETNSRVRCVQIGSAGHTFRPQWAQRVAHQLIDRELDALTQQDRQDPLARAI